MTMIISVKSINDSSVGRLAILHGKRNNCELMFLIYFKYTKIAILHR